MVTANQNYNRCTKKRGEPNHNTKESHKTQEKRAREEEIFREEQQKQPGSILQNGNKYIHIDN